MSAHGTQHLKALHCYLNIGNLAGIEETEVLMQNPIKEAKPDEEKKPTKENEPQKQQPQQEQKK